jgi:hypothetical protein
MAVGEKIDAEVVESLQRQTNNYSAAAPEWESCVTELGLEVEGLAGGEIDSMTKLPFQVRWRGLQFMPW